MLLLAFCTVVASQITEHLDETDDIDWDNYDNGHFYEDGRFNEGGFVFNSDSASSSFHSVLIKPFSDLTHQEKLLLELYKSLRERKGLKILFFLVIEIIKCVLGFIRNDYDILLNKTQVQKYLQKYVLLITKNLICC